MEIWKEIKGFEDYQISHIGNVKSIERNVTETTGKVNYHKERILKLANDKNGYLLVTLYKDKKKNMRKVHRLVAEAFIPNIENKPFINHKNGIKSDCKFNNLEWSTPQENGKHASINGFYQSGDKHYKRRKDLTA